MGFSKCPHYNMDNHYCFLKGENQNDYQRETYCLSDDRGIRCSDFEVEKMQEETREQERLRRKEEIALQSIQQSSPYPPSTPSFGGSFGGWDKHDF